MDLLDPRVATGWLFILGAVLIVLSHQTDEDDVRGQLGWTFALSVGATLLGVTMHFWWKLDWTIKSAVATAGPMIAWAFFALEELVLKPRGVIEEKPPTERGRAIVAAISTAAALTLVGLGVYVLLSPDLGP